MISSGRKYLTAGLLSWQDCLAYRANAAIWALVDGCGSMVMALIWLSVFRDRGEIGGYSLNQMITYYLVASAVSLLTTPHMEYNIIWEIRQGLLSGYLTRPADRYTMHIVSETVWQVMKFLMFLPSYLVVCWFLRRYIIITLTPLNLLFFCSAVLLAYLINCGMKMLLGSVAFWVTETRGLFQVLECLWGLLSGEILPLSLLPIWLTVIGGFLPFKYVVWFPTELFLDRVPVQEAVLGLGLQVCWAVVLLVVSRLVWMRGLAVYEGVGG
ncbi:MAG TPA: hypothetical protein GXX29_07475 [Firmicutes bacterium]|nr:hypothetical protein [Bacillota bacterium]